MDDIDAFFEQQEARIRTELRLPLPGTEPAREEHDYDDDNPVDPSYERHETIKEDD